MDQSYRMTCTKTVTPHLVYISVNIYRINTFSYLHVVLPCGIYIPHGADRDAGEGGKANNNRGPKEIISA